MLPYDIGFSANQIVSSVYFAKVVEMLSDSFGTGRARCGSHLSFEEAIPPTTPSRLVSTRNLSQTVRVVGPQGQAENKALYFGVDDQQGLHECTRKS